MRTHRIGMPAAPGSIAFAAALLLGGGASAQQPAQGAVKEVEATGEAAIVNGDHGQARERAIEDALRKAVEQAAGSLVVSTSETKDFQLVSDRILTHARGYVAGYDVVSEKDEGAGDAKSVVVKVKARVGTEQLGADLAAIGLTVARKGMPRMAVLISEQHVGQAAPSAWWGPQGGGQAGGGVVTVAQRLVENALIDEWRKAGFTFVDMEALSGKIRAINPVTVNPSGETAREIANLADADVIILGTAIATKQGDLGNLFNDKSGDIQMLSCQGSINARVFNADNGEILATSQATKVAAHIDTVTCDKNAMLAAAKVFAADLQAKLVTAWNQQLGGGLRVRMTVKGIASFGDLSAFKTALAGSIRGVQGVDQKGFANGTADLDVRIKGSTEAMAGDLEAKLLGKFKLRVTGMTANTLAVEVVK
jgi:hypothetical protein